MINQGCMRLLAFGESARYVVCVDTLPSAVGTDKWRLNEGEEVGEEGAYLVARMVEEVERFRQGLLSEKGELRYASVRGLRVLGAHAQSTAPELLRLALEDPSLRIQVEAAEAFSSIVTDIEGFREILMGALCSPQYELLVNASFVLHTLGKKAQPLRDDLVRCLQQVYEMPLYFLLGCLASLEPLEENAEIIRGMIESRGRYLLFFFVESFCKMGARILPVLRLGVLKGEGMTRLVCAAALWGQTQDAEAIAILEQAIEHGETPEIVCAASCLSIRLGLTKVGEVGLHDQLQKVQDSGLFSLALGTLCNLAHEAPQKTLQVLRGLLGHRDPERLEQVIGAVGRVGRLGGELKADLAFFFRQAWDLWVARRAPVSFRLLLRDRCPTWLPSDQRQPQSAPRQIDPQLFPDALSDNERRLALRRWAEPLLFRLIDALDSSGQLDTLRLREPLGCLLMAEDVSWSLRHATAEALGRQPREEELSRMLRSAVRSPDTELASGVLLGLERNLELASVFAGFLVGAETSSLEPPVQPSREKKAWSLPWHHTLGLSEACSRPERLKLFEDFLTHTDPELRWLSGRILFFLGKPQPALALFRSLLKDRSMLALWSDALRRMFRWVSEGDAFWLQKDIKELCQPLLQVEIPMLQALAGALLCAVGEPLSASENEALEKACVEGEAAVWFAWIKAQGRSFASLQDEMEQTQTLSDLPALVGQLCSPSWSGVWRERFLLRLGRHMLARHIERFGPWPQVDLEESLVTREAWQKGRCASLEMQRAYAEVTQAYWDALLLRNQQEHFSTPRISSLYHLTMFLQLILRPNIAQEPVHMFQALSAAQDFQICHALGYGLASETNALQIEAEACRSICVWMGEQMQTLFADFEETQEHVQRWRKDDQELLFSEE